MIFSFINLLTAYFFYRKDENDKLLRVVMIVHFMCLGFAGGLRGLENILLKVLEKGQIDFMIILPNLFSAAIMLFYFTYFNLFRNKKNQNG